MNSGSLTIRAKLFGSFGLILALLLVISASALIVLHHLGEKAAYLGTDAYPKAMQANHISRRAAEAERLALRGAIANSPQEINELISQMKANAAANVEDLAQIKKSVSSEQGKALFARLEEAREPLRNAYPTLFELMTAQNHEKLATFLHNDFHAAITRFQSAADELFKHQDKKLEVLVNEMQSEAATGRTTVIVASLLSLMVGLGLAAALSGNFARRIRAVQLQAEDVAAGNLADDGRRDESGDELGRLANALANMRRDLNRIVSGLTRDSRDISRYADRVSSSARQVASSAQSQSSSTSSAAAAVEELTVSIEHMAANAQAASQRAVGAGEVADQGRSQVSRATASIREVSGDVAQTTEKIVALSEQVKGIGNIATVIKEVADQTNLLALNAAIEAARAGEQGRGFAVVADEVRKLAERTSNSVQEITNIIGAIEQEAVAATESMERTRNDVGQVADTADNASHAMDEICASTRGVQQASNEISDALVEQRAAATDLSRNVEAIARMSEENSASAGAFADVARQLHDTSLNLANEVARFRL